jgi:hypothetical protein
VSPYLDDEDNGTAHLSHGESMTERKDEDGPEKVSVSGKQTFLRFILILGIAVVMLLLIRYTLLR